MNRVEKSGKWGGSQTYEIPNYLIKFTQHTPESGFIPRREGVWKQRPVKKVVTVEMKKMNSFKGFHRRTN